MMVPYDKLREWAHSVEPVASQCIQLFLNEAENKTKLEIEQAKECLRQYGYKVYEDPHHVQKEL